MRYFGFAASEIFRWPPAGHERARNDGRPSIPEGRDATFEAVLLIPVDKAAARKHEARFFSSQGPPRIRETERKANSFRVCEIFRFRNGLYADPGLQFPSDLVKQKAETTSICVACASSSGANGRPTRLLRQAYGLMAVHDAAIPMKPTTVLSSSFNGLAPSDLITQR